MEIKARLLITELITNAIVTLETFALYITNQLYILLRHTMYLFCNRNNLYSVLLTVLHIFSTIKCYRDY